MATATAKPKKQPKNGAAGTRYRWKPGRRIPIKATVAGRELERIRRTNGILKPEDVVQEAEDTSNPLHAAFEWADDEAARKYRLHQARQLINSIEIYAVIDESGTGEEEPVMAFVHVGKQEQGYQRTKDVLNDNEMRTDALEDALRFLNGAKRRYGHLNELGRVWEAIDDTRREYTRPRRRTA